MKCIQVQQNMSLNKDVLFNNNHVSIDHENFKYQSMQWSFVIKARQGEVFEVKFDKDLQTWNIHDKPWLKIE